MTEYYVEKFYDEYALKKEDTIIAVIDTGTNARRVCNLLNEQDKQIKELKSSNQILALIEEKNKKQEHIVLLENKIHRMRENIHRLETLYHYRGQEGSFDLKKECWELKQEVGTLKGSVKLTEKKNEQLKLEISKIQKQFVDLSNEYSKLRHRHHLLHDECLDLEIKLKEAESDITSLEQENEQLQRSGLIEICREQEKEIIHLKKELYEALEQYYYEAYSDNPVRRDEHIVYMKKEFKERYGDLE